MAHMLWAIVVQRRIVMCIYVPCRFWKYSWTGPRESCGKRPGVPATLSSVGRHSFARLRASPCRLSGLRVPGCRAKRALRTRIQNYPIPPS